MTVKRAMTLAILAASVCPSVSGQSLNDAYAVSAIKTLRMVQAEAGFQVTSKLLITKGSLLKLAAPMSRKVQNAYTPMAPSEPVSSTASFGQRFLRRCS
jgi:hypothetical protein